MRVMTWNIRHGQGTDPETGRPASQPDLERIARVIESQDADVVGLQELDRNWDRSGFVDQPAWLADRLGMYGVFGANWLHGEAEYGVAILSRYPIAEWRSVRLPGDEATEPRGCLVAMLDTPAGTIAFLTTHFQITFHDEDRQGGIERAASARMIVEELLPTLHEPALLVGDFNADPSHHELDALRGLQDAWVVGGDGSHGLTLPSHPVDEPTKRIDAIFSTRDWNIISASVVRDDVTRLASDHYPVIADVELHVRG